MEKERKHDYILITAEDKNNPLIQERKPKTKPLRFYLYTGKITPKKLGHSFSPSLPTLKKQKNIRTIREKSKDFDFCR